MQEVNLVINFEKPYYFAGENIKGNIEINLNSKIAISGISMKIDLIEYWKLKNNSENRSNYTIFFLDLNLKSFEQQINNSSKYIFPAGITILPFNIDFTANDCSSFECKKTEFNAYIEYIFNVTVHSYHIIGYKVSKSSSLLFKSGPYIKSERKLIESVNQTICFMKEKLL